MVRPTKPARQTDKRTDIRLVKNGRIKMEASSENAFIYTLIVIVLTLITLIDCIFVLVFQQYYCTSETKFE